MTIYTLTDRNWPDFTQLLSVMVNDETFVHWKPNFSIFWDNSGLKMCDFWGAHRKACQCWIYLLCFYNFFVLWYKFCVIWIHSGVIFLNQTSLFSLSVRVIATMESFPTNLSSTHIPNRPLCCNYWQSTISATKCCCLLYHTCSTCIYNSTTILLSMDTSAVQCL